jgi:hypothetical protein
MADQPGVSDYLQTVVAGKTNTTTTVSSNGNLLSHQGSTIQLPISMAQTFCHNTTVQQQPITIQLPTQPSKSVTYVNPVINKSNTQQVVAAAPGALTGSATSSLQNLRVMHTQYAYTQSGTFKNARV